MPDSFIRIAALALAVTFAWAATAKLVRWNRWRAALAGYSLGPVIRFVAAPVVPVAEATVTGLLIAGLTHAGAALSLALLAGFSAALLGAQARRGDRLPCGCFGGAGERDYRLMLWRNALLAVVGGVLLTARRDVSPVSGASAPMGGDVLPALLVAVGIVVIGWIVWRVPRWFGGNDPPRDGGQGSR